MKRLFAVIAIALLASGCISNGNGSNYGNKQIFGTILGAAGGGYLGSKVGKGRGQLAATAGGALLGALMGNSIGQSLDRADQMALQNASNTALNRAPVGQRIQWQNPRSGNYGTITPTRDGYQQRTGRYCREYQQDITVGGRTQSAYGTACRQPDGSWQVVNGGSPSTYQQPTSNYSRWNGYN